MSTLTTTWLAKQARLGNDLQDQSGPTRSMTHPLQKPRAQGAKRKVKQGQPFDPEDLSRRLEAHLAEQRLRAEQRRAARAAKTVNSQEYHHIPKVAATQFERTTSPDVMRQVHKLGQPAIKAHLDMLSIDDQVSSQPAQSLKRSQAMDHAIIERDFLRTRNQFAWDHIMEEAGEMDVYRDVYKPPQRTFANEFSHLKINQADKKERPMSTGDIMSSDDGTHATTRLKPKLKPKLDMTERNNWAQQDEEVENRNATKKEKEKTTGFVKRKPSSWILLGRRSPKQDKEGKDAGIGDSSPSPDGKKASFLARFKRHPS